MFKIKDKFNFGLLTTLGLLIIFDGLLTLTGLSCGHKESNDFVLYLMNYMSPLYAISIVVILQVCIIIPLYYYMDCKYIEKWPKSRYWLYGLNVFFIVLRSMIVGVWMGRIVVWCIV